VVVLLGGILEGCRDVARLEIRVVRKDLLAARSGSQEVKDVLDSDAKAAEAGPTAALVGIHRDAV